MDQFGKENQMGLDVEEIKAGVEVKSTQRRLVKSDFKIIKDNGNANWTEELLLKKYGSSLFHTHGLGVLSMLKGLMTVSL
jgi:UDP-N-acetylmuramyl pentapeptide synthase